jgi:ABC-type multidrug transport system ATPase subunit
MELHITGLSKTYPNGVQALDDVSLSIPTGMFGLLGPNGAGKSTLMRTLATLQDADHGSVQLSGVGALPGQAGTTINVLRDKDAVRRVLGYLPQDFGVYPKVNAEDMLDHLAQLKGLTQRAQRREVVAALLQQTNLYDVRKKALGGFSGGMRQRFGIAQALIGQPKLIVVDEPTAGLDPEERTRFHNLLAEIGEEVIVVLSTHIVSDVSDLCAQLAIMNKGRVLLSGTPGDLTDALSGRIWATSVARSEAPALRERHAVISTRLHAGLVEVRAIGDLRPGPEFEHVEAELEDAYFAAIAGHIGQPPGREVTEGRFIDAAVR